MNSTNVILISMPFASVYYPSLGISLLKAGLNRAGFRCDLKYFNLDYAERIGLQEYSNITDKAPFMALLGEWLFSHLVFEEESHDEFEYLFEFLPDSCGYDINIRSAYELARIKREAQLFVDYCLDSVDWSLYSLVGFTTTFHQTMASLALAKKLKASYSHLKILFGGANVEGEMGIEIHRQFSFIDFVCSGEGDYSLVELVRRLSRQESVFDIPAVISRLEPGKTVLPASLTWMVEELDDLPYPDFHDFFQQRAALPSVSAKTRPILVFETARGCWWGQKNQCTFCGLNGTSMGFRSKSQKRAYEELRYLASQFSNEVLVVDNILDLTYFREFIPLLANDDFKMLIHYETKVNLRPWQIAMLAKAGVCKLQPGIESLCTEILATMNKGCTMLQNVQFMKLCAEQNVYVAWNLLYGFPNEQPESYANMLSLMPLLHHLDPPDGAGQVRADRFSPFFERPREYDITSLEPYPSYQYIYRLPQESIRRIAYHFEIKHSHTTESKVYVEACLEGINIWRNLREQSFLVCESHPHGILVKDGRSCKQQDDYFLEGTTAEIYDFCHEIRSLHSILLEIGRNVDEDDIVSQLSFLVDKSLMLREGDKYLSIAVRRWTTANASSIEHMITSQGVAVL
jgi:ribosomal peptide maturation radical SAM protein 1